MRSARDHAPTNRAATPKRAAPDYELPELDGANCELCGVRLDREEAGLAETYEATGFLVCQACIEATLEAGGRDRL